MAARQEVAIALLGPRDEELGRLLLFLLPGTRADANPPPLLELTDEERDDSGAHIQILEGEEYRYEFKFDREFVSLSTNKPEVFRPDSELGRTGRVQPGLFTGTLPVTVFVDNQEVSQFEVEVRSRKLDYLLEYRWMLRDITEYCTELVMDRFSVSMQKFITDETRDAITLYERFCFLRSLLTGQDLRAALSEILSKPHVAWVETHEQAPPGAGLRADSYSVRQLTQAGPRSHWPGGVLSTIPVRVDRRRTFASVDTTPNRFVKFALERWRQVLSDITFALERAQQTYAVQRGIREVREVIEELDAWLASELFRELSPLNRFPADDQVLQKREGYRDLYRAYVQFELAAKLSWHGGYDVFGAGKRDVAKLYEYWVFLMLAGTLAKMLTVPFEWGKMFETDRDGLNVGLKAGRHCVLGGMAMRLDRELAVDLWFNRAFVVGDRGSGSWTRSMRPDFSIMIRPGPSEVAKFEPIVLHFDAKYRVDFVEELFGGREDIVDDIASTQETQILEGKALRSDLLKMHAYRDAIRRSVGAYVIYPGAQDEILREYHELLPGLGAFPLRPSLNGYPDGINGIRGFLEDVLKHVALQISQHERSRFWTSRSFSDSVIIDRLPPAAAFLNAPPADTLVLLGYVRDELHWNWIAKHGLYNLRAGERRGAVELGSKELACEFVILSCPHLGRTELARVVLQPEIHTREEMARLEYPNPRGSYFCIRIERLLDRKWSNLLSAELIEEIRGELSPIPGAPVAVTWRDLAVRAAPAPGEEKE